MNGNNGNVLDRDEVDELMQPVYKQRKIRPRDVHIDIGANKGDGYMSFLTRVDVTAEDGQEVHVVMKAAPRIEHFRKMTPLHDAFIREILFYEKVVPTFRKFQTETYPVRKPFNATATFYNSCVDDKKEVIVMENIRSRGFELWNRMKFMDHQHIELVLKTYGKFHATSYAMQQKDPLTYSELVNQMPEAVFRTDNVDPVMFEVFDGSARKVRQLFEGDTKVEKKLENFNPTAIWQYCIGNTGDFPVICHGDCWVNNMMFKYDDVNDPSKPTDICLLDFQILMVGSPVMDLSYFFYVSAPKAYLDQLDKYLHIYYDSLCESMREMQCEPTITFEDLLKEWKQFGKFGYNMSLVVSKLMMSEGEEIVDFANLDNHDGLIEAFDKELKHDSFVNIKLKQLTEHMLDNEFL